MIAFLKGTVIEAMPNRLVIDVHGVGYEVLVPLSTFDRLNPLPGQEVALKTILLIRENAHTLYGFATDEERDVFRLLIDRVSGIGPSTAMATLSALTINDFKLAIVNGDATALSRAKGLGKKTAERIILELKDKVGVTETWQSAAAQNLSSAATDAELGLIALGYKQADVRKSLQKALETMPEAKVDELIRVVLRAMN